MTKQELASTIWSAANELRGQVSANNYKDYVIGFMFYKYLSTNEVAFLKENYYKDEQIKSIDENDKNTKKLCLDNLGYFIPYCHLFSTWIEDANGVFTDKSVTDAFTSFNRFLGGTTHQKVFEKIFDSISSRITDLGNNGAARTKNLRSLIEIIDDIPMNGEEDYDVLGFVYEYLLGNFAADSVKKAGDFYTPHEVSLLMSEIVADNIKSKDKIEIYDPACGSGSLLLNIGKTISKRLGREYKNNIVYYAQDKNSDPYNLTRMNLVMARVLPSNINVHQDDTLGTDWPFNKDENVTKTVDVVVENPPYSQKWKPNDDPRYSDYGLAPKTKADYAFLLHGLYHLDKDGIMAIVLPHGVLFRGGTEEIIRTALVDNNNIDTIIGLPSGIFYATGIPTIIMILKKSAKKTNDILFIDASKGFTKSKTGSNKQINKLRECDIQKVVDTIRERKTIEHYSRVVSLDEIKANNYNLNIPRYVDSSEPEEKWDLYSLMFGVIPQNEIDDLNPYFKEFPNIKDKIFRTENDHVVSLKDPNPAETINDDDDVKNFKKTIKEAMKEFQEKLQDSLLDKEKIGQMDTSKMEKELGESILNLSEKIPLIDKYQAFQIYSDEWKEISSDIEKLQADGFDSVRETETYYIDKAKKKESIRGKIIPFEIVQKEFFSNNLDEIEKQEQNLESYEEQQQEIFDSLDEETREKLTDSEKPEELNTDYIKPTMNNLDREDEEESKIYTSLAMMQEIENSKVEAKHLLNGYTAKKIKHIGLKEKLLNDSISFLSSIDDESTYKCLQEKWINSMIASLNTLADSIIQEFASKITYLNKKYSTTLEDVSSEIEKTEKELSSQVDELTASEYDEKALKELKELLKGN